MKSDERHKLKTNQLAVFMREFPDKLRRNARVLSWSGAVIVLAIAAAIFLSQRSSARRQQAWTEFSSAVGALSAAGEAPSQTGLAALAERFAQAASAYPDTPPVTAWNYYCQGRTLLTEAELRGKVGGTRRYSELLDKAEEAFNEVLRQPYEPVTTPAARIALGRIAVDRGQFDAARTLFTEAADDKNAMGLLKDLALLHRERLPATPVQIAFAPAEPGERAPGAGVERPGPWEDAWPSGGPPPGATEEIVPIPLLPAPPPPPSEVPDTGEPAPRGGAGPDAMPDREGDQ